MPAAPDPESLPTVADALRSMGDQIHPKMVAQAERPNPVDLRWVHLHNVHTGEKLEAIYWENGEYVPDAVQALNKVLRDYRNDQVHPMDTGLYDILGQIQARTGSRQPFQVISGYRSPATNGLRRHRRSRAPGRTAKD
mgnify:CR=1 FL=1